MRVKVNGEIRELDVSVTPVLLFKWLYENTDFIENVPGSVQFGGISGFSLAANPNPLAGEDEPVLLALIERIYADSNGFPKDVKIGRHATRNINIDFTQDPVDLTAWARKNTADLDTLVSDVNEACRAASSGMGCH